MTNGCGVLPDHCLPTPTGHLATLVLPTQRGKTVPVLWVFIDIFMTVIAILVTESHVNNVTVRFEINIPVVS
jgi:hypothetical protein